MNDFIKGVITGIIIALVILIGLKNTYYHGYVNAYYDIKSGEYEKNIQEWDPRLWIKMSGSEVKENK